MSSASSRTHSGTDSLSGSDSECPSDCLCEVGVRRRSLRTASGHDGDGGGDGGRGHDRDHDRDRERDALFGAPPPRPLVAANPDLKAGPVPLVTQDPILTQAPLDTSSRPIDGWQRPPLPYEVDSAEAHGRPKGMPPHPFDLSIPSTHDAVPVAFPPSSSPSSTTTTTTTPERWTFPVHHQRPIHSETADKTRVTVLTREPSYPPDLTSPPIEERGRRVLTPPSSNPTSPLRVMVPAPSSVVPAAPAALSKVHLPTASTDATAKTPVTATTPVTSANPTAPATMISPAQTPSTRSHGSRRSVTSLGSTNTTSDRSQSCTWDDRGRPAFESGSLGSTHAMSPVDEHPPQPASASASMPTWAQTSADAVHEDFRHHSTVTLGDVPHPRPWLASSVASMGSSESMRIPTLGFSSASPSAISVSGSPSGSLSGPRVGPRTLPAPQAPVSKAATVGADKLAAPLTTLPLATPQRPGLGSRQRSWVVAAAETLGLRRPRLRRAESIAADPSDAEGVSPSMSTPSAITAGSRSRRRFGLG
ncbi:hypothetical protein CAUPRSCDRAFT_10898 [Caulochytrium protostelioides]|uniref:Uncharacterized protein n=1 Tax=Caulochytrium protostelioides TaxID=1555241 RepID=A0A4P9X0I6_9FUNG|nr:hypothetical protein CAUPRSCDRAFT_10898 [Caulochytrium protostelioides]